MPFKQEKFTVTIEAGPFGGLRLQVYSEGKRLTAFSSLVPSALRSILRRSLSQTALSQQLLNYFKTELPDYKLFVKLKHTYTPFTWSDSLVFSSKIQFANKSEVVHIQPQGLSTKNVIMMTSDMFLSLDTGEIGEVQLGESHPIWGKTSEAFPLFESCEVSKAIPVEVFNRLSMTLPDPENYPEIQTKTLEDQQKEGKTFQYKVALSEETQDVLVQPQIKLQEGIICPTQASYSRYIMFEDIPNIFGSNERKKALHLALVHYIKTKDYDESVGLRDVRVAFTVGADYIRFKNWFKEELETFLTPITRLLCIGNKFTFLQGDPFMDVLLWILPQFSFKKLSKSEQPGYLQTDKMDFLTHYESFETLANSHDFNVDFSEKKVSFVSYEVEIDTTTITEDSDGVPQILIDDKPFDVNEWRISLSNEWMRTTDDEVQILDNKTRDKIKAILALIKEDKTKLINENQPMAFIQLLDWFALKELGVNVLVADEHKSLLEKLMKFSNIDTYNVPKGFKADLRQYQQEGFDWICFLFENKLGGILADDMGLGKTIQAIALLGAIHEGTLARQIENKPPSLIVMPPSLIFNWRIEINKWYPGLKVIEFTSKSDISIMEENDIILVTYEIVRRDVERLKAIPFTCLIVDEAQFVKNSAAGRSIATKQLNRAFTLCLSGTPVENHIGEYFSIVDLALPGIVNPDTKHSNDLDSEALLKSLRRIRPFVLRRTKDLIHGELPPKTETERFLNLSTEQKRYYNGILSEVKNQIKEAYQEKTASQAKMIALTALLRLRQICISPALIDSEFKEVTPKLSYVQSQMSEIIEEGHSGIVFSQFRKALDLLEEKLKEKNVPYLRMDGTTPKGKREQLITTFQESGTPLIFLMSLKVGGVGLNLTRASYVFHLDPWWNPAVEDQATDRVHRIGQQKKIIITRLIMHESVEEKIQLLKEEKKVLIQTVLEDGALAKSQDLKQEDFDFLLS